MTHISVVSPVYRAEECVEELCLRLRQSLGTITEDFEIILIDDRSPDNSWKVIEQLALDDQRIKGIRLSRNFGQHYAITAGLDVAKGDWVVVMDCDLQDPPEKIPALYHEANRGFEVVVARFEQRQEPVVRRFFSHSFWRGLSWLAGIEFDPRIGNFRIMSSKVVASAGRYRERLRFLGGIVATMGFTTSYVSMPRDSRFAGESSYTLGKLARIAADITLAYSDKPLKIAIVTGLIITVLAFAAGLFILSLEVAGVVMVPGWTSVMVAVFFMGGLTLANLGIIGYYLSRVFDEVKRRPLYIVESTTGEAPNTHQASAT